MKNKIKLLALSLFVAASLSACGKIPEGYRGDFADQVTGAKLTIGGSEGELVLNNGRSLKATADTLQFDALLEGKPGIYLRSTSDNAEEMEVFWLFPRKESRKQEADFVWVEAEVMYSRMNAKDKDKVQQFRMLHCENGMLLLDLPTKSWNGGCPDGSTLYDFVRTK